MVRWVKTISLPDSSALISWKPPQYTVEKLEFYDVDSTTGGLILGNFYWVTGESLNVTSKSSYVPSTIQQFVFHDLEPNITHIFSITPVGNTYGLV